MSAAVLPLPPVSETHVNDLWEACQDMHLRAKAEPALLDSPSFIARMDRTMRRFAAAYERFCQ